MWQLRYWKLKSPRYSSWREYLSALGTITISFNDYNWIFVKLHMIVNKQIQWKSKTALQYCFTHPTPQVRLLNVRASEGSVIPFTTDITACQILLCKPTKLQINVECFSTACANAGYCSVSLMKSINHYSASTVKPSVKLLAYKLAVCGNFRQQCTSLRKQPTTDNDVSTVEWNINYSML